MFGFDRDEDVFIGAFSQNFVAEGYQSGAFDDDPVFGPVVVQLQRKLGTGGNFDSFNTKVSPQSRTSQVPRDECLSARVHNCLPCFLIP